VSLAPSGAGEKEWELPENDQPMWPSSDEDTSSRKARETDRLPLPDTPAARPEPPAVPNVTGRPQAGSWFRPNVAPEPIPGVNAPADRPERLADRLEQPKWDQSTQQLPVKPVPVVPVERDVWRDKPKDEQWSQRIDLHEVRTTDRPAEPADRRGLPPEPPRGVVPPASASLARPMRIEPDGRRFEAEATVGIEKPRGFNPEATVGIQKPADFRPPIPPTPAAAPQPAAEEPPKKKRRRGKVLLISGLVLVVVAGLGVAASMPKVANRFELPWAPNAPKGDMPEPAAVARVLQGPDTSGAGPSANGVKSVLSGPAGNGALGQLTGSVIDPATGSTLWDRNAAKAATPASTTKILTTAAALLSLAPDTRLSTKIVQGADPGTVILVGGGDTTLTSLPLGTDSPLYPGGAHVDDLVAQVKKAVPNVRKVQVDLSLFKGASTAPGWEAGDAPSTFATQMAPVMADGGRMNPRDNDSQRIANAGTALASTIASKLNASAGGQTSAPKGAKVVAEVKSAPLTELVADTLELSDDTLADALARQVAIANGEEASFAGGAAATLKVLKAHGFDMSGVVLSDGSGISGQNKISALLLAKVLAAAAAPDGKNPDTAKLRPILEGLPVAGGTGTLQPRFSKATEGKGWVRAKTGTLTGVNTLAGIVLDKDGRVLIFALMSQGSDKDAGRDALDDVAAALRTCGCH